MLLSRFRPIRAVLVAAMALATIGTWSSAATAASVLEFIDTLTPAQADEFAAWRSAKMKYDRQLDAYWARDREEARRTSRQASQHQVL